jgi:hypothetical protein
MHPIWLLAALPTAIPSSPPQPPLAVPTVLAKGVVPSTDLSLLPLTVPGYELRVLDQRKTLIYDAAGTRFEVHLPIFFYLPNAAENSALRLIRQAVDELRRAAHQPDRNEYDFEKLLGRFEQSLAELGRASS